MWPAMSAWPAAEVHRFPKWLFFFCGGEHLFPQRATAEHAHLSTEAWNFYSSYAGCQILFTTNYLTSRSMTTVSMNDLIGFVIIHEIIRCAKEPRDDEVNMKLGGNGHWRELDWDATGGCLRTDAEQPEPRAKNPRDQWRLSPRAVKQLSRAHPDNLSFSVWRVSAASLWIFFFQQGCRTSRLVTRRPADDAWARGQRWQRYQSVAALSVRTSAWAKSNAGSAKGLGWGEGGGRGVADGSDWCTSSASRKVGPGRNAVIAH